LKAAAIFLTNRIRSRTSIATARRTWVQEREIVRVAGTVVDAAGVLGAVAVDAAAADGLVVAGADGMAVTAAVGGIKPSPRIFTDSTD